MPEGDLHSSFGKDRFFLDVGVNLQDRAEALHHGVEHFNNPQMHWYSSSPLPVYFLYFNRASDPRQPGREAERTSPDRLQDLAVPFLHFIRGGEVNQTSSLTQRIWISCCSFPGQAHFDDIPLSDQSLFSHSNHGDLKFILPQINSCRGCDANFHPLAPSFSKLLHHFFPHSIHVQPDCCVYFIGNISTARMNFQWCASSNRVEWSSLAALEQSTARIHLNEVSQEKLHEEILIRICCPTIEVHDWRIVTDCNLKKMQEEMPMMSELKRSFNEADRIPPELHPLMLEKGIEAPDDYQPPLKKRKETHCTESPKVEGNWVNLPVEVILKIVSYLCVVDVSRLLAAHPIFFKAISREEKIGTTDLPWLLLLSRPKENVARFYSLKHNHTFQIPMPAPAFGDRICVGASEGWLVTIHQNMKMHILNPFTRQQIQLPSYEPHKYGTLSEKYQQLHAEGNLKKIFHGSKAIIKWEEGRFFVVFFIKKRYIILYLKTGESEWNWISYYKDLKDYNCFDLMFSNGQVHFLGGHHDLGYTSWDLNNPRYHMISKMHSFAHTRALVQFCYLSTFSSEDGSKIYALLKEGRRIIANNLTTRSDGSDLLDFGSASIFVGKNQLLSYNQTADLIADGVYYVSKVPLIRNARQQRHIPVATSICVQDFKTKENVKSIVLNETFDKLNEWVWLAPNLIKQRIDIIIEIERLQQYFDKKIHDLKRSLHLVLARRDILYAELGQKMATTSVEESSTGCSKKLDILLCLRCLVDECDEQVLQIRESLKHVCDEREAAILHVKRQA